MLEINDKSSVQLFEERARMHQNINSVLDAGMDAKAKHSNIIHDYISKRYILQFSKLKSTDTVLDFGCGVGRITNFLRPKVQKVIGYDASPTMLEIAKSTSPAGSQYILDLSQLKEKNDVVIAHWVLAHISDEGIVESFSQILPYIKDKGRICIFEQTPASDKNRLVNDVYRRRSTEEYEVLFEKLGFYISRYEHVYRTPSYARSFWNKIKSSNTWILPLLYVIEKKTISYKKENIEYYTTFMELKKSI